MLEPNAAVFYDARPWRDHYGPGISPDLSPLDLASVDAVARHSAAAYPRHPAHTVCLENGLHAALDFATVDRLADDFAAWLIGEAGLAPGDRVAIQMPNCLAYPVAVFGILRAGGVVVNINPLYTAGETRHQLRDSGARILVIIDLFADKLPEATRETAVERTLLVGIADLFPALRRLLIHTVLKIRREIPAPPPGCERFSGALAAGRRLGPQPWPRSGGDDPALLQYTGGTTGVAKGAELRHRHILANLAQMSAVAGSAIRPGEDVVLTALPLYHIFAFTFNFLVFHYHGCHNILCPSPRPVSKLRKAFERFPVTKFSGVNLLFYALCQEAWFRERPPRTIDLSIAGGTALHGSTAEQWHEVVGSPILEGFGLTETSPVLSVNPPHGENRLGTVGIPVPGCDVRIVDDNGRPVPQGECGEIVARGPQVFEGYWQRPDETAATLRDGWFHTGDIGFMDADGYITIVDRKKDMIDVSGFNVYPNEVEERLAEHPDVLEVAVVGAPRGEAGETVVAFVVSRDGNLTEEALIVFARERLTAYKVPQRIVFRNELPKTPVGKLLRRALRDDARAAMLAE